MTISALKMFAGLCGPARRGEINQLIALIELIEDGEASLWIEHDPLAFQVVVQAIVKGTYIDGCATTVIDATQRMLANARGTLDGNQTNG